MGKAGTLAAGIASWAGHSPGVTNVTGKVPASLQHRGFEEHQTPSSCLNCGHHATPSAALTVVPLLVLVAQEQANVVGKIPLQHCHPRGHILGPSLPAQNRALGGMLQLPFPCTLGCHGGEMKEQDMP